MTGNLTTDESFIMMFSSQQVNSFIEPLHLILTSHLHTIILRIQEIIFSDLQNVYVNLLR